MCRLAAGRQGLPNSLWGRLGQGPGSGRPLHPPPSGSPPPRYCRPRSWRKGAPPALATCTCQLARRGAGKCRPRSVARCRITATHSPRLPMPPHHTPIPHQTCRPLGPTDVPGDVPQVLAALLLGPRCSVLAPLCACGRQQLLCALARRGICFPQVRRCMPCSPPPPLTHTHKNTRQPNPHGAVGLRAQWGAVHVLMALWRSHAGCCSLLGLVCLVLLEEMGGGTAGSTST